MEVYNYRDAIGRHSFRDLAIGVLRILCLPTSNGEIERVFSQVNVVKSKKRNRMKMELLDATLHCKFGLTKYDKKVEDFEPPRDILNYTAAQIYPPKKQ